MTIHLSLHFQKVTRNYRLFDSMLNSLCIVTLSNLQLSTAYVLFSTST